MKFCFTKFCETCYFIKKRMSNFLEKYLVRRFLKFPMQGFLKILWLAPPKIRQNRSFKLLMKWKMKNWKSSDNFFGTMYLFLSIILWLYGWWCFGCKMRTFFLMVYLKCLFSSRFLIFSRFMFIVFASLGASVAVVIYLFIYLFICLFIYLFIYLCIFNQTCLGSEPVTRKNFAK